MQGQKMGAAAGWQEIVRAQLTLRAVVWDIPTMEDLDAKRLEREMESFQVYRVQMPKKMGEGCGKRYAEAVRGLQKMGILEEEALLVTEDVRMAEYVYGLRNGQRAAGKTECPYGANHEEEARCPYGGDGMGVVYYEKPGSWQDVSADMVVLGFEEIGVQFLDRIQKRRNRLPWNILYTERTCVREVTMGDLDELYALYAGEGITDYTAPLLERKEEEEYTRSYIEYMYYYYGYGMWVVRDRETGRFIGRAGIERREVGEEVCMELGYIIGREYQNKGYATEVCQAIIEYAQQELEIEELHCFIHPHNKASLHLAEKLGFGPCAEHPMAEGLLHFCYCCSNGTDSLR